VALLTITPSRSITRLEGEAVKRALTTWRAADSKVWHALVGIPLESAARPQTVVLRATDESGHAATGRITLKIVRGRFVTRRLRVDRRFADPPAAAADRIAREARVLSDLFTRSQHERLWRGGFTAPVPGASTSTFGRRTILNGKRRGRHLGADFRAAEGTPVRAPNAGLIVLADDLYLSGNTVVIDHGGGLFSLLSHLSRRRVPAGARVARGDLVGDAGSTGRVTGPHLHWAVRLHGTAVNPLSLMTTLATLENDASDGQQPIEECAIPPQRDAEILRRHLAGAFQLMLERGFLLAEDFRQPSHDGGHERVGLFHSLARLIDEAGLDCFPTAAEPRRFIGVKQRVVSGLVGRRGSCRRRGGGSALHDALLR
jgi:murein DD-endopeptidase MepM/ murein hydrolase activator NlpD